MMEIMIVLALVALLASLVSPVLVSSIERAREASLKENLLVLRKAIDDYYTDRGEYPGDLDQLVQKKYVRRIPADPVSEQPEAWLAVPPENGGNGIADVRSRSAEKASDGTYYRDW